MNDPLHQETPGAALNDAPAQEHAIAQMMACGVWGPKRKTHDPNPLLPVPVAKKRTAAVAGVFCTLP